MALPWPKIFMALPWPKTQRYLWPFNGQKYFNATANNIYGLTIAKSINGPFMAKNTLHFHFNQGF